MRVAKRQAAQGIKRPISGAKGPSPRDEQAGAAPVSPDSIYPIPDLFGDVNVAGVNLFTGDINLSISLANLSVGRLNYAISAFYNGRDAVLGLTGSDNSLGSNGWKLIDYPKLLCDQNGNGTFYFLDGFAAYPLTPIDQSTRSYAIGGKYAGWTVTESAMSASWTVVDTQGVVYTFANRFRTAAYDTLWNLSAITDGTWPASTLSFVYSGNQIQSIASPTASLAFDYDSATGALACDPALGNGDRHRMVIHPTR